MYVVRGARSPKGRRAALWGLVLLSLTSCLAPTLPLPPPGRPNVSSPDPDGNIRIRGVAQSRAVVFAHNLNTDQVVGEVTGSSGAYDLTMAAEVGDRISVWQSVGTRDSAGVEVLVPLNSDFVDIPPPPESMGGTSGD